MSEPEAGTEPPFTSWQNTRPEVLQTTKYELETTERTRLIEVLIEVNMPLLENHLEQIMLSSNAIAELP